MIVGKLLTAAQWAKRWGVCPRTARRRLAEAYARYGSDVVDRRETDGAFRASEESLARIRFVEDFVTIEQHDRAMADLRREIAEIKRRLR